MANTFTQLYAQIVFAVQGRQNLISKDHKEELHKYITGIVRKKKQKLLAIHCMPDHTHVFIGFRPDTAISDLIRDVKANSSAFVNEKKWVRGKFSWQEGFGAFTYSHSQLTDVITYIRNQEAHHLKRTFRDEYLEMLEKFQVEYDQRYLFEWIE